MRNLLLFLAILLLPILLNGQSDNDKIKPTLNQLNAESFDKYVSDGTVPPRSLFSENNSIPGTNGMQRCMTDEYADARKISHPEEKEAIRKIREIAKSKVEDFIACDGSNTIVIPVAVHYDASFDCSNTQCLIDAALGNIASMNEDFAAINADIIYYNDFNAACPASYPLDIVSDGTCISFCLATQNHPAGKEWLMVILQ